MRAIPSELARNALDAAPDAMLIVDEHAVILFANRHASTLFGYAHDELIGQPIETLIPERFRSRHVGHRDRYMGGAHLRPMGLGLDLYARRRDGSEFPVEIGLSPLGGGKVTAAIRDASEHKRSEAELVAAREAAIEARISADRANQAKSRFLATASHDLRQPLQTLALLNRTLRSLVPDRTAGEALAQQEQTIGAMSKLLNALLDISKLESGAIKPEPTDFTVAQLFEELRREFAALAADKGLDLQVESCSDRVRSDPSLVEEILRNLVSNAIKYTRKGYVKLRCLKEASSVRIEVLDTGVGIPAEQIPNIFDEFYQVGIPTNSTREGYGLGLSIVHRIASLLNLRLEVRSAVGQGSAFSIALPAAEGREAAAVRAAQSPAGHKPRVRSGHVLLVEDEPSVRKATTLLLTVEGYLVIATASLSEALQAARENPSIELLITDYHLRGEETGLGVISAVRQILGESLKVLLITGDTSSAMRKIAGDSSLQIISKPVNAEELLRLLQASFK